MIASSQIQINNKIISPTSPAYIIAEAGVNHNGDIELAKQLVDIAKDAGVDAVKFQSFKTEHLILESVEKADYQKVTTGQSESQFEMLKKLEINLDTTKELKRYCEKKGIVFLTTPFDEFSLDELDGLDLAAYKISSTDITNIPFLRRVAKKGKPVILSTGMTYMKEVELAVKTILELNKDLILLHCTSNYPVKDDEVNLNVLTTFKEKFKGIIGYSDHTPAIGASPYSIVLGAKLIEKHFTIDKNMEGPDHKASLSPEELKAFVKEIRKVEQYMGSSIKEPTPAEMGTRNKLQKCLVACAPIQKGEVFSENNIIGKRTGGNGISALNYDEMVGKKATRNFQINDIIHL